ncbi:MAG: hypothetical protein JWM08_1389 [Candidatus Angelobacter sp.]|nr:hypothetical protein [Candidatus Angelobacter sp.]
MVFVATALRVHVVFHVFYVFYHGIEFRLLVQLV